MKFQAKVTDVTKVEADLLAVFASKTTLSEAKTTPGFVFSEEAKRVDAALGGMLTEVATAEDFEAKSGNLLLLHSHGKVPAKRLLLVGLGQTEELTMADWQTICASLGRRAKNSAAKRLAVALPSAVFERLGVEKASQGALEGVRLGTYVFNKHQSESTRKQEKVIDEVWLLAPAGRLNAVSAGIALGEVTSEAVIFARDLVNEPPSFTTPTYLAQVALSLAKGKRGIACEVLGKSEMEKLGMGALLGVARGSEEEPKFIKLSYRGGGRQTICLVGKGITFDTGGLSLKKAEGMETMKMDMAGAAAILALFQALSLLKPKINVVGLICATENMPSGRAIKPGDIVRAMNGKTIEILNTDAEGRVILADGLSYAAIKVKPDILIDLATLTGACVVALGEEIAGLFANQAKLAGRLKEAANSAGEKIWELPLAKEYQEILKSSVADLKNISGKHYGGAINAALFLQEFVPANIPWAHLDIAGPAFAEKDTSPLNPRGGTGSGVRLILSYLLKQV